MPKQDYNINTRDLVLGQIYGLKGSAKVVDSWELEGTATVEFAEPVVRVANKERACKSADGVSAAFAIAGFAVRQANREQNVRAGDGTVSYKIGETVPVLRFGCMQAKAGAATTMGGKVYFNPTTKAFYSTNDSGAAFEATNAVFDSVAAAAGDVVRVRILTIA